MPAYVPRGKNIGRIDKLNRQNREDNHLMRTEETLRKEVWQKKLYYLTLAVPEEVNQEVVYLDKPVLHKGKLVVGTMDQLLERYGKALKAYNLHRFDHRWFKRLQG